MSSQTEKNLKSNPKKDLLKIRLIFKKKNHELSLSSDKTISHLKQEIHSLTSVAPEMQKLIHRGKNITENHKTLAKTGIKNNDKILLVGSTIHDVSTALKPSTTEKTVETSFSKQLKHMKIIDQGVPEDAMMAYKNGDEPLPTDGIKGIVDKYLRKCRIGVKLESDELWVSSGKTTTKYPISEILDFEEQPIEGQEEYHILKIDIKFGRSLWYYWIPDQFIKAIKKALH